MITSLETLTGLLKIAGFILPALGLTLLIVGLRGRRIGDAPHCRKCKYNLTGVPSTRCPECEDDVDYIWDGELVYDNVIVREMRTKR